MLYRLRMPELVEGAHDFCILQWHKEPDNAYDEGDLLLEVETEKSIIEVRAPAPGVLRRSLREPGQWLPFGADIALVSDQPDDPTPPLSTSSEPLPADLPALDASLDIG